MKKKTQKANIIRIGLSEVKKYWFGLLLGLFLALILNLLVDHYMFGKSVYEILFRMLFIAPLAFLMMVIVAGALKVKHER